MGFLFNGFSGFDVGLILKLMVMELLVGAAIGVIKKEIARFSTKKSTSKQVMAAKGYVSPNFGENLPRGSFNLLGVPTEFVVVDKDGDEIVEETFYSLLGEHISIINGRCTLVSASVLASPIYLLTIVFPLLFGFLGAVFLFWWSPINQYAAAYMFSGLSWGTVSAVIMIIFNIMHTDTVQ